MIFAAHVISDGCLLDEGFNRGNINVSEYIEKGLIDAVAFGRDYIANPDLVARLQRKAELNPQRSESFYGGGAEGYTDYPTL